jgi:hypothetical protein
MNSVILAQPGPPYGLPEGWTLAAVLCGIAIAVLAIWLFGNDGKRK